MRSGPRAAGNAGRGEGAVRDAAGDFLPLADDAAAAAWDAWPGFAGDQPTVVDGLPGDDVEAADTGGLGLEHVDGAAVVPLGDRGDGQSGVQRLADEGQGELDVLPGVRGPVLDADCGFGDASVDEDAAELVCLVDVGVAVLAAGDDDQWGQAAVVAVGGDHGGLGLIGAEDEVRGRL